jgi:hypothetical protein
LELNAEHEIIAILVDERMARRARATDRLIADAWANLVAQLVREHGPDGDSAHRVLPVALDAAALQLTPDLNETGFVLLDARQGRAKDHHLILHVAVRALRLLQNVPRWVGQAVDQLPEVPIRLFISHAKGDLPRDPAAMAEGPVKAILSTLTQVPVEGWYDAARIPAGGRSSEGRSGSRSATRPSAPFYCTNSTSSPSATARMAPLRSKTRSGHSWPIPCSTVY